MNNFVEINTQSQTQNVYSSLDTRLKSYRIRINVILTLYVVYSRFNKGTMLSSWSHNQLSFTLPSSLTAVSPLSAVLCRRVSTPSLRVQRHLYANASTAPFSGYSGVEKSTRLRPGTGQSNVGFKWSKAICSDQY